MKKSRKNNEFQRIVKKFLISKKLNTRKKYRYLSKLRNILVKNLIYSQTKKFFRKLAQSNGNSLILSTFGKPTVLKKNNTTVIVQVIF